MTIYLLAWYYMLVRTLQYLCIHVQCTLTLTSTTCQFRTPSGQCGDYQLGFIVGGLMPTAIGMHSYYLHWQEQGRCHAIQVPLNHVPQMALRKVNTKNGKVKTVDPLNLLLVILWEIFRHTCTCICTYTCTYTQNRLYMCVCTGTTFGMLFVIKWEVFKHVLYMY